MRATHLTRQVGSLPLAKNAKHSSSIIPTRLYPGYTVRQSILSLGLTVGAHAHPASTVRGMVTSAIAANIRSRFRGRIQANGRLVIYLNTLCYGAPFVSKCRSIKRRSVAKIAQSRIYAEADSCLNRFPASLFFAMANESC